MKVLHLICNSHIDPVWQWDWDEGASATLATFYSACNLLDKYDFVFCHNEVIVYEYIEKHDPELFARIQKLVEEGKWKIMGGWYCQPDCFVPSGESFIRQITLGREYFQDKFNARPRSALNFDSFGHTRGLPQILKKTGFDSYMFCRPMPWYVSIPNFKDYPHGPFLWEGYDGSRVKALRYEDQFFNYTTPFGKAVEGIEKKESQYHDLDIVPVLWGVGNHGGTSSEKDLDDILQLQKDKKGEWEIKHSTLEEYFDSVEPTQVEKRQIFVFSKAYSSVNAIKLAHDQLENALYQCERICTVADIAGKYTYNKEILKNAERALAQIEFHDVMAGTAIKTGIDSSIRVAYHAIQELKDEMFAAFTALSRDLPKVTPQDDNNVLINPYPYDYDGLVEIEIYPVRYIWKGNQKYSLTLYDMNGKSVEYQQIKEESNIADPHRIRLLFKAHIPAFSVVSYGVHHEFMDGIVELPTQRDGDIVVEDDIKRVVVNGKTGNIDSFVVNGVERLSGPVVPMMFTDNADPWGWRIYDLTCSVLNENGWPTGVGKSTLKEFKADYSGKGITEGIKPVTVVEDGDLLTEVQVFYKKDDSRIVATYRIYKNTEYIDVNYHVLWNEASKGLKIKVPVNTRKYFTQLAFGVEKYVADGVENPGNRYYGVKAKDDAFVIYNKSGVHSASMKGKNLYITLLNGSAYCAHPTNPNAKLTRQGRYVPYIEQGVHDFFFRFGVNKMEECEKLSQQFNEPIYAVLAFPHGDGKNIIKDVVKLSNNNVVITGMKKRVDGTYLIRLYNGFDKKAETTLIVKNASKLVKLSKYEFKTYVYDGKSLVESKDSSIY